MHVLVREPILERVIPTRVLRVARTGHRPVVPDVRKGIATAGGIVLEHRIGAEGALATKGHRAQMRRGYAAVEFVVERLTLARAVDRRRVALSGQAGVRG